MRILIALAAFTALPITAGAWNVPTDSHTDREIIEAGFPGLYSFAISIDGDLQDHPRIMNQIRESALQDMAGFAAFVLEDYQTRTDEAPDRSWNEYSSDTVITVTFARSDVVSLNRTRFQYTGGAHPGQSTDPVVTRPGNLVPVGLEDIIGDTAPNSSGLTALFYAVYRELMALKRSRLGADFDESMERETWMASLSAELGAFPGFTLIPNTAGDAAGGLMFHFDPYEVGSSVEGGYDVAVPLSVFEAYLSEAWVDVFDGAPASAVLTATGDALEPIVPAGEE